MGVSRAQKKKKKDDEEEGGMDPEFWMVTFGDLLSLLITFFVMLFAMSTLDDQVLNEAFFSTFSGGAGALSFGEGSPIQAQRMTDMVKKRRLGVKEFYQFLLKKGDLKGAAITTSLNGLEESLLASEVTVKKRGPSFSLVFPVENMFESGSAKLKSRVKAALNRLGNILRFSQSQLLIEGHTDDLQARTAQFPSNWELSAGRAGNVMRYFVEHTALAAGRIMAVGYADTKPVVKNMGSKSRARNRRVEIVIRQAPGV